MQGTLETSQYMKQIEIEMQTRVAHVKSKLTGVYFDLLMSKIASALPSNFLLNVYKIKKTISAECSQQF